MSVFVLVSMTTVIVAVAGTAGFQICFREGPFELPCHQSFWRESRLSKKYRDAIGDKQLNRPFANAADDDRPHALLREPCGERSGNMFGSLLVRLADNVASGEVGIDDAEVRSSAKMLAERRALHRERDPNLTCDWTRYCLHIGHKPITMARMQIKSDFLSNPRRGVI